MSGTGFTKGSSGTVYGGPGRSETVYDPARYASKPRAKSVDPDELKKWGNVFFGIAALSAYNVALLLSQSKRVMTIGLGMTHVLVKRALISGGDIQSVFVLTGAAILLFLILGVFARGGSLIAYVIGFLLYGADTVLLCWDGVSQHSLSVVMHVVFLIAILGGMTQAAKSRS